MRLKSRLHLEFDRRRKIEKIKMLQELAQLIEANLKNHQDLKD